MLRIRVIEIEPSVRTRLRVSKQGAVFSEFRIECESISAAYALLMPKSRIEVSAESVRQIALKCEESSALWPDAVSKRRKSTRISIPEGVSNGSARRASESSALSCA